MKIFIIKKKNILISLIFVCILLFLIIFFNNKTNSKPTLYPLDFSKTSQYDLNSDGIKDSIEIIQGNNKIDIKIKSNSKDYYLSNEIKDNTLFSLSNTLNTNIFVHTDKRTNIPKIIIMGNKNNLPITYVFQWNRDKQKFELLRSTSNNIFGIIDCKNSKTPQYFSIDTSKNRTSLENFMIINNSSININNDINSSYDTVLNFINVVQLPYELDELPNIFSPSISKDELSVLWNLNKENFSYEFQNGFFYDYNWNDNNDPTSLKYRLSFKQKSLTKSNNIQKEYILLIDLEKNDSTYKITSIQKCK